MGQAAGAAGTAAQPAAGAGGLPDRRQHAGAARPDRVQHERGRAAASPAGLLRRPGRPGQHAGRPRPFWQPRAGGEPMTGIEAIAELFAGPGARDYLGEAVTIGEHMRQAGALAEAAGAAAPLVAAALLHDIGHLRSEPRTGLPGGSGGMEPPRGIAEPSPRDSTDARHGRAGAQWLSQWFGAAVTEPVRLHVAAKRYLCATEP